jgi:hypothetical protein
MNYPKHLRVLSLIALAGLLLTFFTPRFGLAILLPALGAYLAARISMQRGASQPPVWSWAVFFALVATLLVFRSVMPENELGFEGPAVLTLLRLLDQVLLGVAYLLFGFLAYLQRLGRKASS